MIDIIENSDLKPGEKEIEKNKVSESRKANTVVQVFKNTVGGGWRRVWSEINVTPEVF